MGFVRSCHRSVLPALCLLLVSGVFPGFAGRHARACDWDSETLLEERSRFPTALEIILGKFPRHTKEYYQWRIEDRQRKLQQQPLDDRLLDDIAVSYEKLSRYDDAIQIATEQLQRNPDRYESLANLGTFLIHDGRLAEGLPYIEKAIEVNPDAHFGREKYQVILVKYVLSRSADDGIMLPLSKISLDKKSYSRPFEFVEFLNKELGTTEEQGLSSDELQKALKGVLGMMRFSRHDSPILLEVLAELETKMGAEQLAFRAYLSAAQHVDDPKARRVYEQLASHVIWWKLASFRGTGHAELTEKQLVEDFHTEQVDAEEWFARLAEDERRWIAAGLAVDEKFNARYREMPEAIVTDPKAADVSPTHEGGAARAFFARMFVVTLLASGILATLVWFGLRTRRGAKPLFDP